VHHVAQCPHVVRPDAHGRPIAPFRQIAGIQDARDLTCGGCPPVAYGPAGVFRGQLAPRPRASDAVARNERLAFGGTNFQITRCGSRLGEREHRGAINRAGMTDQDSALLLRGRPNPRHPTSRVAFGDAQRESGFEGVGEFEATGLRCPHVANVFVG
jgi:hypothetical protein